MAANKSQELIQQLLQAEKQADEIIANAKKARLAKLRQAKEKAEDELKDFRAKEEAKFQSEMGAKATADPSKALEASTKEQIAAVRADYDANKAASIKYIVSKVLEVSVSLTDTQLQALKTGSV
eukprot:TRINITY_DN826_c1_g2_i2.p1 TRINITY_DN826_c1_g2~~TRINITY_DN826_c1_g2_i2.p1  ORF type:complete len:124 (-),score=51.19 TRINITY_DN826_c1_g2_i2:124-495(-)